MSANHDIHSLPLMKICRGTAGRRARQQCSGFVNFSAIPEASTHPTLAGAVALGAMISRRCNRQA